jgi:hypothetical protein
VGQAVGIREVLDGLPRVQPLHQDGGADPFLSMLGRP